MPMLRTYATEAATLSVQYRSYDIEVSRVPKANEQYDAS